MPGKLVYTRGLPGSGKTTFARNYIALDDPAAVRVNRDDLRGMLHEGRYAPKREKIVTQVQMAMISDALSSGRTAICDDTNLNPRTVKALTGVAACHGADVDVMDLTDVSLATCIERDRERERTVGEDVIRGMWDRYLRPPLRERTGRRSCVIVDVDGTLAQMQGRSPYAWSQVGEDRVNPLVRATVAALAEDHAIIVLTGRDGVCRDATEQWLLEHHVRFDELHSRPAGNNEKDWVIKQRLLHDEVLPRFDPVLAIDDRQQVVDLWRAEGIECWQVDQGRF